MPLTPDQLRNATYILGLISSFPCLAWVNTEPEQWDIDAFMQSLGTASSGERLCMLFIANVWNPGYARESSWTFDVMDFASSCDRRNRAAFIAWLQNPRFP